jgi:hypothetical protein
MAWSEKRWLKVIIGMAVVAGTGFFGLIAFVTHDISTPESKSRFALEMHQAIVSRAKEVVSNLVFVQDKIGNCYAFSSVGEGTAERILLTQINCSPKVLEAIQSHQ